MSPHEAGFTELGVFIETSLLGSRFENGGLLEVKPEMDMVKLQGMCSTISMFKGEAISDSCRAGLDCTLYNIISQNILYL